jgi:hypothetical protein
MKTPVAYNKAVKYSGHCNYNKNPQPVKGAGFFLLQASSVFEKISLAALSPRFTALQ